MLSVGFFWLVALPVFYFNECVCACVAMLPIVSGPSSVFDLGLWVVGVVAMRTQPVP